MSPDDPVPDSERTAQDNREPAAEVGAHSDAVPFEEIAERVGVDARTAKRYVARALAHCQRVISTAERGRT